MKREIKFRAYHIPTKKMFDVFSWCKDCVFEDSMDGVGTSPTLPAEMKDCVLMQFTGLKDCNDKDIYEGDILENAEGIKGTVDFLNGSFCSVTSNLYYFLNNGYLKNKKIIGNIYEKI